MLCNFSNNIKADRGPARARRPSPSPSRARARARARVVIYFWAQILKLRAHFDEILTLRGTFLSKLSKIAQILTLRAHVPDIRRSDFIAFWSSALKCPKPRQPFHMRVFGHLSKTHGCSLTLASFPLSHDLQKIFLGGQNKPAVFFPQRGRIGAFFSIFRDLQSPLSGEKEVRALFSSRKKNIWWRPTVWLGRQNQR